MQNILHTISTKNKFIAILVFSVFSIGFTSYLLQSFNSFFYILSIICFLLSFIISIYSLIKLVKLEKISKDLEEEKLVNKNLNILYDNIRAFRHDFNNIIQAIGGYISIKDIDGLSKYYSQLLDDCQRVNNISNLNPNIINNPALYSLLASKYYKADALGIKINFEICIDLNTLKIKIYELSRMLGILLDNAIEASIECNEKVINIKMRKDEIHNRQLIIIENTYINKEIDLDKIFEKSYSTKPNNTGLGLWEVRQLLNKNNNLNLYTAKNHKYFRQQLEIYV